MMNTNTQTITGRIIKGVGGLYTIIPDSDKSKRITASAKGTFRHEKITPTVGDIVSFDYISEESAVITDIHKRKNLLVRPACANVDCLVITACAKNPKPDIYMLDKLSAVALYNNIKVLFVFNKCDICPPDELVDIYSAAGFKTVGISAAESDCNSEGILKIKEFINSNVSFFAGASGVGKSSLMNVLFPDISIATGGLSRKISRGKHTTRATELYMVNDDTYIADTPGFSSFDVAQLGLIPKDRLLEAFPDIYKNSSGCVYTDCTHTGEGADVCSVKAALERGEISPSRHESFVKLYGEISAIKEWDK